MRETKSSRADCDGIVLHRVVQWGEEGLLGCWKDDDDGVSEFANNLLEDLDRNGTFAENAFEALGDAVRFGLGKLNGAAVAVYEETEEFFCLCPACVPFLEFFQGDRVLAAGVP